MTVRDTFRRMGVTWAEAAQALSHRFSELRELEAGEPAIVEVELDCCWREGCGAPVPRHDDLGLCRACREQLRTL